MRSSAGRSGDPMTQIAAGLAAIGLILYGLLLYITRMPGASFQGASLPLSADEKALADELKSYVEVIAGEIGSRSVESTEGLRRAEQYLVKTLQGTGLPLRRHEFELSSGSLKVSNFDVELRGTTRPEEVVVVGAHYDSVAPGCPGANDNGTGVAAVLALAARFKNAPRERTLRFVFFVNEEPPYFQTGDMGSARYVEDIRERKEKVVAMLSLETMGYFSDASGSQKYPFPFSYFYPSTGNFIAFVGNIRSISLVRRAVAAFRGAAKIPSEGVGAPGFIPGVGWSDHAAFWGEGIPALMVTDTAPFRYPHYHTLSDTPDKIDYPRLALVVSGLAAVIDELAGGKR